MQIVRQKAWSTLEKLVNSVASERSRFRRRYVQWKDDKFGRERIATDKFGNSYYQYYSYHGLPTRRIVLYKFVDGNRFNQDPHFIGWLRKNELIAPTQEELEKMYLEHDAFVERAIEWDKNEIQVIEAWDAKKKELDEKYPDTRQQVGEVQAWNPSMPKIDLAKELNVQQQSVGNQIVTQESQEVSATSEIDRLEQEYLHEYYLLAEKNKRAGKDLNKVAHDEMVRAQHHFDMLRKVERQNYAEQMARKNKEETLTIAPVQSEVNEISGAQKRVEMIARQLRRSKLERQNREVQRQRAQGDRYAMFAEEFGDVFENIYDKTSAAAVNPQVGTPDTDTYEHGKQTG